MYDLFLFKLCKTQVDIVKREADRQRLMREDFELELQALRHQILTMQSMHTTGNNSSASDSVESVTTNQRFRFLVQVQFIISLKELCL